MQPFVQPLIQQIGQRLPARAQVQGVWRSWFEDTDVRAYLRLNQRLVDGVARPTLELCDVTVRDDVRGRGLFRALLAELAALARVRGEVLFLANVVNPLVRAALERRGALPYGDGESFIWKEQA